MRDITWLRSYERRRKSESEGQDNWVSSKYDTSLHWKDLQQTFIPELQMNWGQACSALKKTWRAYKMSRLRGEYAGDLAYRLNKIKSAMGLELNNEFPELEGVHDWGTGGSEEKEQLSAGEEHEEGFGDEESSLDRQLMKEEKEAIEEWWMAD